MTPWFSRSTSTGMVGKACKEHTGQSSCNSKSESDCVILEVPTAALPSANTEGGVPGAVATEVSSARRQGGGELSCQRGKFARAFDSIADRVKDKNQKVAISAVMRPAQTGAGQLGPAHSDRLTKASMLIGNQHESGKANSLEASSETEANSCSHPGNNVGSEVDLLATEQTSFKVSTVEPPGPGKRPDTAAQQRSGQARAVEVPTNLHAKAGLSRKPNSVRYMYSSNGYSNPTLMAARSKRRIPLPSSLNKGCKGGQASKVATNDLFPYGPSNVGIKLGEQSLYGTDGAQMKEATKAEQGQTPAFLEHDKWKVGGAAVHENDATSRGHMKENGESSVKSQCELGKRLASERDSVEDNPVVVKRARPAKKARYGQLPELTEEDTLPILATSGTSVQQPKGKDLLQHSMESCQHMNSDTGTDSDIKSEGDERSLILTPIPEAVPSMKPGFLVSGDISKGWERIPISCVDEETDGGGCHLPRNFRYQLRSLECNNAKVDRCLERFGEDFCNCEGNCLEQEVPCTCSQSTGGIFGYRRDGRLIKKLAVAYSHAPDSKVGLFITECSPKCACAKSCGNRIVQQGIRFQLQLEARLVNRHTLLHSWPKSRRDHNCPKVFMTRDKGWGIRALECIPARSFVFEYIGEIMTNEEQMRRNEKYKAGAEHAYQMQLDADGRVEEAYSDDSLLCLDATCYGNVSRFMNHSCGNAANVFFRPVQIDTHDTIYYHVAFFANRDIQAMEEITWDYGENFDNSPVEGDNTAQGFRCKCGGSECRDKSQGL